MRSLAKLSIAVVLVLGVASVGSAAAEPKHGWDVRCGHSFEQGFGWFASRGYNRDCRSVRRVANHYVFESFGDRRFNGYRCDEDQVGDEVWRVDCKRRRNGEHQHVRFKYGA